MDGWQHHGNYPDHPRIDHYYSEADREIKKVGLTTGGGVCSCCGAMWLSNTGYNYSYGSKQPTTYPGIYLLQNGTKKLLQEHTDLKDEDSDFLEIKLDDGTTHTFGWRNA